MKEFFQLVKWDNICLIVQIRMACSRNKQQFFVILILVSVDHSGISVLAKIAGMRLVPMKYHYRTSDFIAVLENWHIHKGLTANHIPTAV